MLHALFLMREMVCGSYATLLKRSELPHEPFVFTDGAPEPTSLEMIFFTTELNTTTVLQFNAARSSRNTSTTGPMAANH